MDEGIRLGLSEEPLEKKRRGFGTGLAVVLAVFALLSWRRHGHAAPWYAGASALGALLAWLAPSAFGPVYGPWMKAAGVLAEVNTTLITALIYFLVFTPYALILRALGRDPLAREGAREGTDWLKREPLKDYAGYERPF